MGYCALCSRWDQKQGGNGHAVSCTFPTASTIGSDMGTWNEAQVALKRKSEPRGLVDYHTPILSSARSYSMYVQNKAHGGGRIPRGHPLGHPAQISPGLWDVSYQRMSAHPSGLTSAQVKSLPLRLPAPSAIGIGDQFPVGNRVIWELCHHNAAKTQYDWSWKSGKTLMIMLENDTQHNWWEYQGYQIY